MPNKKDVIWVFSYIDADGNPVGQHPFIVIEDRAGSIEKKPYRFIGLACSSYKSRSHKLARVFDRTIVNIYASAGSGLKKDSFVKCDTLVYFNEPPHNVIGSIDQQAWKDILRCVKDIDEEDNLELNINNL